MVVVKVHELKILNEKLLQAYFRTILDWIRLDRNRVIFLIGDVGSGKSTTALFYKYTLDSLMEGHPLRKNEFCWDDITFTAKDFLRRVKDAPGHVIIFDEAGVGAHARKWYDAANIAISQAAQVFRYKRNVILATVPRLKMVDKHPRDIAHEIHVVSGKIIDDKYNIVYPRYVNYNAREDKTYLVMPQYAIVFQGKLRTFKVRSLLIPLPPKWLVKEYKKMQEEFKESILKDTLKTLEMIEEGTGETKTVEDYVSEVLEVLAEYPRLITEIVAKRGPRYYISARKLRDWPEVRIPKQMLRDVSRKLNEIIFGDIAGIDAIIYLEKLSNGSLYETLRKLGRGGTSAV